MTSMPCKYNDIHACDDSFGCHLHLQPALGSKLRFYNLIHIYIRLSLKAYGLKTTLHCKVVWWRGLHMSFPLSLL